jgi:hypothetical protein
MDTPELPQSTTTSPPVALDVPAIFCNVTQVAAGPVWVRLAFGETGMDSGDIRFRAAIALPIEQAQLLSDALRAVIENMRQSGVPAPSVR